jgi:hypothetical protein
MALLDLSSDLSRFRSQFSREEKNTAEASKATNNKNFATVQPITAKLSSFSPTIKTPPTSDTLPSKLSSTKLDDIRKFAQENLLVNSVSKYSPGNISYSGGMLSKISTEQIETRFNKIQKPISDNNLHRSNVVIIRPSATKTVLSPVDLVINKDDSRDNIETPNIKITTPPLSIDRTTTSPNVLRVENDAVGNIQVPNVVINKIPLAFDRESHSPKIIINKSDTTDNVVDPKIDILRKQLAIDRKTQSPNIITDTIKEGLVVDPNTSVIKIEQGTFHLGDESELNPSGKPIRFISESKLANKDISEKKDVQKYDGISEQLIDNSRLNIDSVVRTIPYGRNEDPNKSKLSIVGTQSVNFFKDDYATGFVVKAQKGISEYNDESVFSWKGNSAPSVNFMRDDNARGFQTSVNMGQTLYKTNSSKFGFTVIPEVDFFDVTRKYTSDGFTKFVTNLSSAYQPDASSFAWRGAAKTAPGVDYFDKESNNTIAGFHTFAQNYDTKYIVDSSRFNWDGSRSSAPEGNYFDITGTHTTVGFHKFAQVYDTKYVPESSVFDWDGKRQDAPATNYFDLTSKNTTAGFHKFAQMYDTKYVPESSRFDWDGLRVSAPEVNYFDLTSKNTTAGFHRFAQIYDTKYAPESSRFDWDGDRQSAPSVNYFDLTNDNTTTGFHTFAQVYDTKYVHESSRFDWDGTRGSAPEVNYFDITGKFTAAGFHRFAQKYDTKYVKESSEFDWDGTRISAPEVNYFDISKTYTTNGFHRFAELYDTKYIKDSSRFDWDGDSRSAPKTNFFIDRQAQGFVTFPEKLKSEYKKEISEFTFKGGLPTPVDFFANTQGTGFINKAQRLESKYKRDISTFTFKGGLPNPVDFFSNTEGSGFINKAPHLTSSYNRDASRFTFKGGLPNPVDFFSNNNVDGFTIKTTPLESKYQSDVSRFTFTGTRSSAPSVDYITNGFANGFTNLAQSLKSEYKIQNSRFTWNGNRNDAPAVDFFKIPGQNPNGVSGFNTFFIDKTGTKYSDSLSSLSIESSNKKSPVKNVPYTTFFGYRPQERSGFMVNMSTFDGTLFPILDPLLKFDYNLGQRTTVSIMRSENPSNFRTTDLEKYAPLSLGKRPWANGTLFATLDSQIPNLKTKAPAGSYSNKYERTMKDTTEKLGYLTKWAITRRSPSPLDDQYSKYKLQDESVNREVAAFNQPYVVRGIQRVGEVENQRWGFGVTFDDGIVRGGTATQAERILQDVFRIGKFTLSVKGALFNIKQFGLQAMNPVVDVDPVTPTSGIFGISSTLGFNPLSIIGNVATARAGGHYARHGVNPLDSAYLNKYETATTNREFKQRFVDPNYTSFGKLNTPWIPGSTVPGNVSTDRNGGYSRLIGLMKELLPVNFQPMTKPKTAEFGPSISLAALPNIMDYLRGTAKIERISSNFGGPNSFLGIGGTDIRRSGHPYLGLYTTTPMLYGQKEPGYLESAKRESFYGAINSSTYADELKSQQVSAGGDFFGILKAIAYIVGNTREDNAPTAPSDLYDSIKIQDETKNKIKKLNPFDPKYDSPVSRIQRITADNVDRNVMSPLHLGPSDLIADSFSNPIKKYRTLAYNKLQKVKPGVAGRSALFNDFRHDLESSETETFTTNPKIARYETRNLENYFGMGKYGKPGAQRNLPFISNVIYSTREVSGSSPAEFKSFSLPQLKPSGSGGEFRGDRINIIDYKRANFNLNTNFVYEKNIKDTIPGTNDLVDFYFTSLVLSGHNYCPAEVIVFRATFDTISDNHKPSWNSVKYMGRADPLYTYQSYERSISFGFTVHIGSRDEMKASWRKLNYLASWTAPQYTRTGGFMRGPMIRLNIGNLYRKMPGYIASLTYTFDNSNGYWETAKLLEDGVSGANADKSNPGVLQLPKHIQVSCEFVPIGVYRPEMNGTMYSLYDDRNTAEGGIENGLIPSGQDRVNYFRTFDKTDMKNNVNQFYLPVRFEDEGKTSGSLEDSPDPTP